MPITPQQRERLGRRMNDRRLELGITWRDVAARAGLSYEALRKLRLGKGGIRDLTGAKVSGALAWEPGSVQAILDGREPSVVSGTAAGEPDDASVTILRGALSAFERAIMDSSLSADEKAEIIASHRRVGGDAMLAAFRERISARRRSGG